jgi:alkanesulfonate monooxygenase SsuD/methylene tetrahydromethanopterin reductase-like flavin-dependent oxidoreductase (luciferase family)
VRIGVTLPTFRDDAYALDAAREAEHLGLDGVFVFDHLWPMGKPGRPALSAMPVLGAVCAVTERVKVGSLVARIGLLPDELLVESLTSLDVVSGGRFVAGLGTGDRLSEEENLTYGIRYAPREERLASLRWCATRLLDAGLTVWVGGRGQTVSLAEEIGAVVNLWGAGPEEIASIRSRDLIEVTWGGVAGKGPGRPPDPSPAQIVDHLTEIGNAGATWAVSVWPASPGQFAEVADEVRRRLGSVGI